MKPLEIAEAFRSGAVSGPKGPLQADMSVLTDTSLLLFTTSAVIKVRRPVLMPGNDQRELAQRVGVVELERWVGRRVAPAVYLEDVNLELRKDGGLSLVPGPPRVAVEPVVAMMRLHGSIRADAWLAAHPPKLADVAPVMTTVAAFHERAPLHREPTGWGAPGRITARWQALLAALPTQDDAGNILAGDDTRARLAERGAVQLEGLADRLAHRVAEGRVRFVHGDIRLEHVFLTEPVSSIIGPADGDEDRHWTDTAEDVALFVLELLRGGFEELAWGCTTTYMAAAQDRTLPRVLPFFQRLVAVRRATECWHAAGLAQGERAEALRAQARDYLAWAMN